MFPSMQTKNQSMTVIFVFGSLFKLGAGVQMSVCVFLLLNGATQIHIRVQIYSVFSTEENI